jgi:putative FmdB family regulatory protein
MPTYEYRCAHGHTFEVMQRMSDDPLVSCQSCEAPVQRLFHPVAVHFKGSGFYNTDYGTRNRARESAESAKGGESKGGESKGGESKGGESKGESSSSNSGSSAEKKSAPASTSGSSSD